MIKLIREISGHQNLLILELETRLQVNTKFDTNVKEELIFLCKIAFISQF